MIVRTHLIPVLTLVFIGVSLLAFSNPNRLTHDHIVHGTFVVKLSDPAAFTGDYLYGDPRIETHDNFFVYRALRWLAAKVGSLEVVYWYALPVLFILFSVGMYALLWTLTQERFASFLTALVANLHIPYVFMSSWGLSGPSEVGPKEVFTAFLPFIFLLLFLGMRTQRTALVMVAFFVAGFLGNVHPISAFYFVPMFVLALFIARGPSWETFRQVFLGAVLAVLGALPYLVTYWSVRWSVPSQVPISDPVAYAQAAMSVARHAFPAEHLAMLWQLAVQRWYLVWPFVAVFIWVLWRRRGRWSFVEHFNLAFVFSVIAVSLVISVSQWVKWYAFGRAPFYQIPRGMHFLYLPLMLAVGIFLADVSTWFRREASPRARQLAISLGVSLFVLAIPAVGRWFWQSYDRAQHPQFSYRTCDDGPYVALRQRSRAGDVLLVDPDYFPVVRVCTARPVVVSRRDNGVAYSLGPDRLIEWARRYEEVQAAFQAPETLPAMARRYKARFILSRTCVPVSGATVIYRHPNNLNCVYELPAV